MLVPRLRQLRSSLPHCFPASLRPIALACPTTTDVTYHNLLLFLSTPWRAKACPPRYNEDT